MDTDKTPAVSFSGADITSGENVVIHGLDMEVFPGDLVYITGKVGTGKTSIVRTIIAENPPENGSGTVLGYRLESIRRRDIPALRKKIGIVFQDFQLLMDKSVEKNLEFVLKSTGWKDPAAIRLRIDEVLDLVGMKSKSHKYPYQLSGGEKQRVCIARAILNSPELILADEPTANLDAETAESIIELLLKINAEGTTIIMVTHRQSIVDRYPGRVFHCKHESCLEVKQ